MDTSFERDVSDVPFKDSSDQSPTLREEDMFKCFLVMSTERTQ